MSELSCLQTILQSLHKSFVAVRRGNSAREALSPEETMEFIDLMEELLESDTSKGRLMSLLACATGDAAPGTTMDVFGIASDCLTFRVETLLTSVSHAKSHNKPSDTVSATEGDLMSQEQEVNDHASAGDHLAATLPSPAHNWTPDAFHRVQLRVLHLLTRLVHLSCTPELFSGGIGPHGGAADEAELHTHVESRLLVINLFGSLRALYDSGCAEGVSYQHVLSELRVSSMELLFMALSKMPGEFKRKAAKEGVVGYLVDRYATEEEISCRNYLAAMLRSAAEDHPEKFVDCDVMEKLSYVATLEGSKYAIILLCDVFVTVFNLFPKLYEAKIAKSAPTVVKQLVQFVVGMLGDPDQSSDVVNSACQLVDVVASIEAFTGTQTPFLDRMCAGGTWCALFGMNGDLQPHDNGGSVGVADENTAPRAGTPAPIVRKRSPSVGPAASVEVQGRKMRSFRLLLQSLTTADQINALAGSLVGSEHLLTSFIAIPMRFPPNHCASADTFVEESTLALALLLAKSPVVRWGVAKALKGLPKWGRSIRGEVLTLLIKLITSTSTEALRESLPPGTVAASMPIVDIHGSLLNSVVFAEASKVSAVMYPSFVAKLLEEQEQVLLRAEARQGKSDMGIISDVYASTAQKRTVSLLATLSLRADSPQSKLHSLTFVVLAHAVSLAFVHGEEDAEFAREQAVLEARWNVTEHVRSPLASSRLHTNAAAPFTGDTCSPLSTTQRPSRRDAGDYDHQQWVGEEDDKVYPRTSEISPIQPKYASQHQPQHYDSDGPSPGNWRGERRGMQNLQSNEYETYGNDRGYETTGSDRGNLERTMEAMKQRQLANDRLPAHRQDHANRPHPKQQVTLRSPSVDVKEQQRRHSSGRSPSGSVYAHHEQRIKNQQQQVHRLSAPRADSDDGDVDYLGSRSGSDDNTGYLPAPPFLQRDPYDADDHEMQPRQGHRTVTFDPNSAAFGPGGRGITAGPVSRRSKNGQLQPKQMTTPVSGIASDAVAQAYELFYGGGGGGSRAGQRSSTSATPYVDDSDSAEQRKPAWKY